MPLGGVGPLSTVTSLLPKAKQRYSSPQVKPYTWQSLDKNEGHLTTKKHPLTFPSKHKRLVDWKSVPRQCVQFLQLNKSVVHIGDPGLSLPHHGPDVQLEAELRHSEMRMCLGPGFILNPPGGREKGGASPPCSILSKPWGSVSGPNLTNGNYPSAKKRTNVRDLQALNLQ